MDLLPLILSAMVTSFATARLLVATAPQHGRFTMDLPDLRRKAHRQPAPRVGGIGIYLGLLVCAALLAATEAGAILNAILLAAAPALSAGLLEDLTRRVAVGHRLAATLASGLLWCAFSGVAIRSVHVPGVDALLAQPVLAIAFTSVCIAGMANAINIVDGQHGLASGTAVIQLGAFALLAGGQGDWALVAACGALIAALLGFWAVNFPWGRLFLGDGGAYFTGLSVACVGILLPARHPAVSPWATLLVCAYPVTEVAYSALRRGMSGRRATEADGEHLHSLVALRVVGPALQHMDATLQNATVSVLMWLLAALPALAALLFPNHTLLLMTFAAMFALLYHSIYQRLARR